MSERMTGMSFGQLMEWILTEKAQSGTVFGIHRPYYAGEKMLEFLGRELETPIGPAAGPHTQLAQNIIASYYAGARFFELKTVQKMDGDELAACVNKPCILAEDEGYNCEWSTELYVPQAMSEYIRAWFALHVMAAEFQLGSQRGFQFNMSVGYDLAGIRESKINTFIDSMMDASGTETFAECREWLLSNLDRFEYLTREHVLAIPSQICNSATISTLHGCPPGEIESIADYLLREKHLHTFIKCNPTLLGYEFARKTMNEMGYDYMAFGDFHFLDDLQYGDAVPMLRRLMVLADELGLEFGVKITNTFPVDVTRGELPSEEMYMSGRALFPLSISLAARLSHEFDGKLRISYSGGADFYNMERIVACGIWPVTVATTLLKPGGYQRFTQIAELWKQQEIKPWNSIDTEALENLAQAARGDARHKKGIKPLPKRKIEREVPLLDCFFAPCQEGCPIHQDIPAYIQLVGEGKYKEALQVILEKNALPFITGTLCAHNCMSKCTRNFYEQPVNIRAAKLHAAENGYEEAFRELGSAPKKELRVAVIGGGPSGIAASYFLAREGVSVTLFEKREKLGGVIRYVIPDFRISEAVIDKDISLIEKLGVDIRTGVEISHADMLTGVYDAVIVAIGACIPGELRLLKGTARNALDFLEEFKRSHGEAAIGENVVVVGGGNTAMDTARAAKRAKGTKRVTLVYRRTKKYMPAAEEEIRELMEEGIEIQELLSPVSLENGVLVCRRMALGEMDASGRASVVETEEFAEILADTVLAAVGEKVPSVYFRECNLALTGRGKVKYLAHTMESSKKGLYVIGDCAGGPATIVEGIRDAAIAAEAILGRGLFQNYPAPQSTAECCEKKGSLKNEAGADKENERCLACSKVCENCVDVCPNRANVSIEIPGMGRQILHIDNMCNECGNCRTFCPYASTPYKDKFTLFAKPEAMEESTNDGFAVLDKEEKRVLVRLMGNTVECRADDPEDGLFAGLRMLILTVLEKYEYLL